MMLGTLSIMNHFLLEFLKIGENKWEESTKVNMIVLRLLKSIQFSIGNQFIFMWSPLTKFCSVFNQYKVTKLII